MKEKAAEETISHATFQVRQSMRTLGSGLKARSLLIASRQENVRACDKVLHAWANSIWRKRRLRLKHSCIRCSREASRQILAELASWAENWSESVWLMSSNHVSPFALMNWLERDFASHKRPFVLGSGCKHFVLVIKWMSRSKRVSRYRKLPR